MDTKHSIFLCLEWRCLMGANHFSHMITLKVALVFRNKDVDFSTNDLILPKRRSKTCTIHALIIPPRPPFRCIAKPQLINKTMYSWNNEKFTYKNKKKSISLAPYGLNSKNSEAAAFLPSLTDMSQTLQYRNTIIHHDATHLRSAIRHFLWQENKLK